MTILVFGGNGQVGQELLRALAPLGKVVATTRSGVLPDGSACETADFGQPDSLPALLDRLQPSIVVNAAAYTAVDRAEQEVDAAVAANAQAPGVIARWCAAHGVPFVHYSTDYVFDGQGTAPYREDEPTAPLGVYGTSKRDGEDAVRAAAGRHLIFRTAWVYASHGANFLRTMLRVGAASDRRWPDQLAWLCRGDFCRGAGDGRVAEGPHRRGDFQRRVPDAGQAPGLVGAGQPSVAAGFRHRAAILAGRVEEGNVGVDSGQRLSPYCPCRSGVVERQGRKRGWPDRVATPLSDTASPNLRR